jgi:hypothetical protein
MNTLTSAQPTSKSGRDPAAKSMLLAAAAVALVLYFIPGAQIVTYPLHLFTTIVHEGGHAVMTYLTGGSVLSIGVSPDTSGATYSLGGIDWLIYMAGYLGAITFGAIALHIGRKRGHGRRSLVTLGTIVLCISLLWIHPWSNPFGFAAGAVIGGLLLAGARFLPETAAHFTGSFLAVQLSLNAIFDMRNLLWLTTNTAADNDAVFMAKAHGLTPWFWASLWAIIAAGVLFTSLRAYWRSK